MALNSTINTAALRLTFDDEFNSFVSSPDGSSGWMTEYPFSGAKRTLPANREAEYYSDSSVGTNPFSIVNGVLDITATKASVTGANASSLPYNSGVITSYTSFSQLYGYFEVRAELPAGQGLWPAFWLMPTNGQSTTELDIFEQLGNQPNTIYSTTHSSVSGTVMQALSVADTSAGFHTYGVDWEPDTITFYMDGKAIAATNTPADFDTPMYMLLNLAVGGTGSWPGATSTSTTFPATLQIDYVHVYATANTQQVSGTQAIPSGTVGSITGQVAVGVGVGTPIGGVTVSVLDSSGTVLATTTTSSTGAYIFAGLAAGIYTVRETPPAGYAVQAGSSTTTAAITVLPGITATAAGLKLSGVGSISGTELLGTALLAGATVTLLASNASGYYTAATTTTDSTGAYSFSNLYALNYEIKFTAPSDDTLQSGPADSSTGVTSPITITGTAGQTVALAAEVLSKTSTAATVTTSAITYPASANTATTPFALGAYLGYPTLTAAGEATFETSYNSFVSTMGAAPKFIDVGFNIATPISTWAAYASGSAQAFATLADTKGTTPVISLPMASTASGSLSADAQYQMFASGQYDSVLQGIVKAWANDGFQNLVFRPGWEMNVVGGPTYAGSDAQSQADWVSAFQHIYTVLHQAAAADGVSVQVVWNPSVSNYGGTSTLTSLYPGNNYVDVIGADVYADAFPYSDYSSTSYHDWATGVEDTTLAQFIANPVNQEHYWSDPAANQWVSDASSSGALSLTTLMAFAQAQGKPFAIPEAGAGNSTAGHDVTDDAAFPAWLSQQLLAAQASGLTVSFVNLWDTNGGGSYEFSQASDDKPLEAAAWAKYFGATSNTSASTTPVATTGVIAGQVTVGAGIGTAVGGVTVSLLGSSGTVLATTTTSSSGTYSFTGLTAGTYTVRETPPTGYAVQPGGSTSTAAITVTAGNISAPPSLKLSGVGSITGTELLGSTPLAGATVTLLASNASGYYTAATTTTSSTGAYSFSSLYALTYEIKFTTPSGDTLQSGPADSSTGITSPITLTGTPGQSVALAAEILSKTSTATLSGIGQSVTGADGTHSVTGTASNNFDDGKSDLVMQNTNGSIVIYTMDGLSITGGVGLGGPGPSWHVVGTADFNGDAHPDLLMQNDDGDIVDYLMNGTTITNGYNLGDAGSSWHVRGTADFNGDGKADILLQNDNGSMVVWNTNGQSVTDGAAVGVLPAGWAVEAVADFNGDGHPDLLAQSNDGSLVEYTMNGSTITGGAQLGNPGAGWSVAGTGDYNADGKADILLHSDAGQDVVWEMNGTTVVNKITVGYTDPAYTNTVAGLDLNGDGNPDLVIDNPTNSQLAAYTMNSNATITAGAVLGAPGAGWNVVGGNPITFIDGTGSNLTLAGTPGPDQFNLTSYANGVHTISSFNPAQDTLALSESAFPSYATVQANEQAYQGGTFINLTPNAAIVIQGVTPDQLSSKDFVLR